MNTFTMPVVPHARRLVLLWLMLAAVALLATDARSYPEPNIISSAWQFEFDFKQPRVVAVTGIDGERQFYWYLPYTVTNRTGEDRTFVPRFTVLTNEGHLIEAGRKIEPAVFEAIKKEQRNDLLESPVQVIGRLLQGQDNARDSVAIWRAPDADVDRIWVFVSGLSGETATIQHPLTDEKVVLRKTLMLDFEVPGTLPALIGKPITDIDTQWVMR